MAGILATLIDHCEIGLQGGPAAAFMSESPTCPHCEARGISIVVRGGGCVMCMVCGLTLVEHERSTPSLLLRGCAH